MFTAVVLAILLVAWGVYLWRWRTGRGPVVGNERDGAGSRSGLERFNDPGPDTSNSFLIWGAAFWAAFAAFWLFTAYGDRWSFFRVVGGLGAVAGLWLVALRLRMLVHRAGRAH